MEGRLESAPFSAIVAEQLALSEASILEAERAYESGARTSAYWAIWDLRSSASYRLSAGDRNAYVRMEVFAHSAKRILSSYPGVAVFKELGDAVLVRSDGLRPLIESACVLSMLSDLWGAPRGAGEPSLATRSAVTFGAAVELRARVATDFVGAAIDRLARLAGQEQKDGDLLLLDEGAYDSDPAILEEYGFLRSEGPLLLDASKIKPGESPIRYFRISADRGALVDFRHYFQALR